MSRGTLKKVFLNFIFFFLVIYSYYIAKPIRNSLFLEWMGPKELPFVYLLSAVITLAGAFILNKLLQRFPPNRLISSTLGLFSLILVMFWWLFLNITKFGDVFSFLLYLFISLFSVTGVTLFWATCNDTHTEEESQKYYNIIGLGGILGGLAGSITTKYSATLIGTENLLLASAGILAVTLPLPYIIISKKELALKDKKIEPIRLFHKSNYYKDIKLSDLLRVRYLLIIAGFVFLFTAVSSLLDFQYQTIIKRADLTKDVRTEFFGLVYTLINVVGIFIHLLFTRSVLKSLGPAGGLMPLPQSAFTPRRIFSC